MNKTTSIIEINGNRYDAVSGKLIGAAKKAAHQIKKPINGLSIDGFTRTARMIKQSATKRSIHATRRRPEHSRTLMRTTIKRPDRANLEDKLKARGLSPDYARASRVKNISRNSKVQRFGLLTFSRNNGAKNGEVIKPGASLRAASTMAVATTVPSVMGSASHHRLERLLDYALAHADAHKKALEHSTKAHRRFFGRLPRWLAFSLIGLFVALVAGFFVWQKLPAASFKLAASKAHVNNASLPTPISGYKIGPITAHQNTVTTTIQSTSDSSKKYTVTEKASNQPAASLAAGSISGSSSSQQVQTVQDKDRTYVLSQDKDKSTAACTKGTNTVSVEASYSDLNVAQLLEATKNACKN